MVAHNLPRFRLGQTVATPDALKTLKEAGVSPIELLHRHVRGDWGDLHEDDRQANEDALRHGGRILSAYVLKATGKRVWVITEADRSSTCVLLPENY